MLEITMDMSSLIEKLDAMSKELEEFPTHMGEEMTEWQTEDMRRRFPHTEAPDEHTVKTSIWPTSRYAQILDKRKIARTLSSTRKTIRKGRSNKPILREHLFDTLTWRMRDLMGEYLKWQ